MNDLRPHIAQLATRLGVTLEPRRVGDPPNLMRFITWYQRGHIDFDERLLALALRAEPSQALDLILEEVTGMQRRLFRAAIDHIAKHDREPLDRVKAIETHARQLIDALGGSVHDDSGPVGNAVRQLGLLLPVKPGAVSWARDGYGKDEPR